MPKQVLKNSPYKLVYKKETRFPISWEVSALQLLKSMEVAQNGPMAMRLEKIMELEEARETAFTSLHRKLSRGGLTTKRVPIQYSD